METTRVCRECKIEYPIEHFYKHVGPRTSIGYRRPTCKACCYKHSMKWQKSNPDKSKVYRRRNKLKKKYGISLEQYDEMLKKKNCVCYICHRSEPNGKPLNEDHCHKSGIIRKMLCTKCNFTLGLMDEDKTFINRLIDYINEHKEEA